MAGHQVPTDVAEEQRVRQVIDEWRRLTAEKDIEGVLSLTADDAVFLTPGNPPIGKTEFEAGMHTVLAKARIESTQDVREIRVSGDQAYAWSHLAIDLIPEDGGPTLHSTGYTLTVFHRTSAGEWRLARDANLVAGAGKPDRI